MKLNKFLIASKVCDPDGTLSLSNLAMFVLIIKLAVMPILDLPTLVAFAGVLLNHNAKKHWNKKKSDSEISQITAERNRQDATAALSQAQSDEINKIKADILYLNSISNVKNLSR